MLLRDGRSLFGVLRSIDQFANLVLHLTVERIYIGDEYGEIDRGVFLIRGENVVLCGEVVSIEYITTGYRVITMTNMFSPFNTCRMMMQIRTRLDSQKYP